MSQLTTIAIAKMPLGEIHIESYGSTVFATMTFYRKTSSEQKSGKSSKPHSTISASTTSKMQKTSVKAISNTHTSCNSSWNCKPNYSNKNTKHCRKETQS